MNMVLTATDPTAKDGFTKAIHSRMELNPRSRCNRGGFDWTHWEVVLNLRCYRGYERFTQYKARFLTTTFYIPF